MTDRSRPLLAVQALIASLLILSGLGTASAAAEKRIQFNIVAQDLASALNEFARQSAQELLFSTDLAASKRTSGIVGEFAPTDALKALLQGTGLRYRINNDYTILIERGDPDSARRNEIQMSPFMTPMLGAQAMPAFRAAQEPEGDAQDGAGEPKSEDAARLGAMTVTTGSHIAGAETTSPLLVYGREDFEKVGAVTVQQFMATVPQNFGGGQTEDTLTETGQAFNPSFGSALNLRGLGSSATLVLVNGRRMALGGSAEFADVSMIPLTAVERIEVLTDGASATYGSDAVGGVVNFIMKKDYTGAETRLLGGGTTQGDGERYQASQSAGTRWETGSVLFNYEFYSSQATNSLERDFAASAAGPYDLVPEQERHSVLVYGRQELSDRLELSAEVMYSRRDADFSIFETFTPEVQNFSGDTRQYGASLGLFLDLGNSWQAELSASANRNKIDNISNSASQLNGFGPQEYRSEYRLWGTELLFSGDLWNLPGGPMRLAVGGGYRDESYEFLNGIVGGLVFTPRNDESASSHAAFAELSVPVVGARDAESDAPRVLLSLAGRYEEYDSFGSTFDPKVGVRWSPIPSLALRATYGTSFKTPSVLQINEWNSSNFISNLASPMGPVRSVVRGGNNPDLTEETATTWTAGIELSPQAWDGFTTRFTWFDVDYEDRIESISGISNAGVLNDPFYASRVIRRGDIPDAEFDALIAQLLSGRIPNGGTCGAPGRDPATGACLEPVMNFNAVVRRGLSNISIMHVSGLDLGVEQRLGTSFGEFNFNLNASYLFDYEQQISDSAPIRDFVDVVLRPVDLRASASATWSRNGWGATINVNYTDGYTTGGAISPTTGLPLVPVPIEAWTTVDLSLRYDAADRFRGSWFDGVMVSLVASNLLDKDPPTFEDQIVDLGYDPANADPLGRLVLLSLTKRW